MYAILARTINPSSSLLLIEELLPSGNGGSAMLEVLSVLSLRHVDGCTENTGGCMLAGFQIPRVRLGMRAKLLHFLVADCPL